MMPRLFTQRQSGHKTASRPLSMTTTGRCVPGPADAVCEARTREWLCAIFASQLTFSTLKQAQREKNWSRWCATRQRCKIRTHTADSHPTGSLCSCMLGLCCRVLRFLPLSGGEKSFSAAPLCCFHSVSCNL
eukprot:6193126-Pleurochrysis_carterae.AAC.1